MNASQRRPFSRKREASPRSTFAEVLPRVRRMREQAEWQSFISPRASEQRRDRIVNVRKRIVYRPCVYEPITEWTSVPARTRWLDLVLLLVFLFTLLVSVCLLMD
jgi:hypothetical protein